MSVLHNNWEGSASRSLKRSFDNYSSKQFENISSIISLYTEFLTEEVAADYLEAEEANQAASKAIIDSLFL
jgi:hypothetical protein